MLACEEGGGGFKNDICLSLWMIFCGCSWSSDTICLYDVVVQWNGKSFKGGWLQNVTSPSLCVVAMFKV